MKSEDSKEIKKLAEEQEKEIVLSELHQNVWSVVSFEKCIKGNLTYDEALAEMERLKAEKVSGLCIITDEAAERIKN